MVKEVLHFLTILTSLTFLTLYPFLKKTSYPNRNKVTVMMIMKKIRMKWLPLEMAVFAPRIPPIPLQTAIGMAIFQRIAPFNRNKIIEPQLVDRLTSFALALACKKSSPSKVIKASTKKLPAPGPIKPS